MLIWNIHVPGARGLNSLPRALFAWQNILPYKYKTSILQPASTLALLVPKVWQTRNLRTRMPPGVLTAG